MAPDSNSPSDERTTGLASDRLGATGLKLVGERGAGAGPATAPSSSPGRTAEPSSGAKGGSRGSAKVAPPARQLPLWLFGALFVVFLIAFGYQTHQAGQFEVEVSRLEASLAKAEGRLESHRTHLLEIRGGVHDLSSRVEDLRVLIDRDPTAEVELKPASADPAAPAQP